MTLNDVINHIDRFDDDDTIYAKQPWTPDSEAIVATEPDNGGIPAEAVKINAEYFLEIFLANEFLEDWSPTLDQSTSMQDRCLRLIQYAKNDA